MDNQEIRIVCWGVDLIDVTQDNTNSVLGRGLDWRDSG